MVVVLRDETESLTSADGDNDDRDDDVIVAVDDDCDKQHNFRLDGEVEEVVQQQAEGLLSSSDGVVVRVRTIGLNCLIDGDIVLLLLIILPLIKLASSTSDSILFRSSRIFRFSNFLGRLEGDCVADGDEDDCAVADDVTVTGVLLVVVTSDTTTTSSLSSSLGDCVISVSDCGSRFASIISFRILSISVGLIRGGCGDEEEVGLRVGGGGRDGLPLFNAMALLSIISCLPGTN